MVIGFILSVGVMAQISDPREIFGISATVIGGTNSNCSWTMPSGEHVADGRMKRDIIVHIHSTVKLLKWKNLSVSLSPFYNFSNRQVDTEWGSAPLAFTLPATHHHFGGRLMVNYQFKAWGKPLTLMAMSTGNFSQYGYENASGLIGGLYTLTYNRNTYFSVGAIYLLGTAVFWPLYPMIIYSHKFNEHWSINCMGPNNYLYYHASPTVKYALGMELETNKYYFRPSVKGLPEKSQFSLLSEHLGIFADWQTSKSFSFNIGMGVNVPFYGRVQESGYQESYMNLKAKVKPFVSFKVKYSLRTSDGANSARR